MRLLLDRFQKKPKSVLEPKLVNRWWLKLLCFSQKKQVVLSFVCLLLSKSRARPKRFRCLLFTILQKEGRKVQIPVGESIRLYVPVSIALGSRGLLPSTSKYLFKCVLAIFSYSLIMVKFEGWSWNESRTESIKSWLTRSLLLRFLFRLLLVQFFYSVTYLCNISKVTYLLHIWWCFDPKNKVNSWDFLQCQLWSISLSKIQLLIENIYFF